MLFFIPGEQIEKKISQRIVVAGSWQQTWNPLGGNLRGLMFNVF
jgi:hypothetical protein